MICGRPTFLEGARGIAAWIVVFHHLTLTVFPFLWLSYWHDLRAVFPTAATLAFSPLSLLINGKAAVSFFFVHSGFVLSFHFFNQGKRPEYLTSSAVRRYPRLALPAIASVLISYALMATGLVQNAKSSAVPGGLMWLTQQLTFAPDFLDAAREGAVGVFLGEPARFNPVLWTIGVELLGSYLIFAFLALFGRSRARWVWYLALAAMASRTFYLHFVLGMALCDGYVACAARGWLGTGAAPSSPRRLGSLAAAGLGVYLLAYRGLDSPFDGILNAVAGPAWQPQLQGLGAVLLITALLLRPDAQARLERPFFQRLGARSYSVYLFHLAVISTVGSWTLVTCFPWLGRAWTRLLVVAVCVPLIYTVSAAMRALVDAPAIKLSHKVYGRWFAAKAPTATGAEGAAKVPEKAA